MTELKTPKFSVITVSYQHADFIRQTIESVLLQKYPNFEHIVIDGGSTDGTIEILKEYPHLKWTSEPDRGQSHALNKGFARATGDIIAWINSDDWYPPNIFKDVALALEDYPIVMGACEMCDKYGVRLEDYPNIERNWFDLLKYWVFCSSPSQPSIFFRRDLLEAVKRPDGRYLDEDLEFCMDLDLWLRMAERFPMARRVKKVFSYLRNYDTNKTGEMWDLTLREMSRVFRRHSNKLAQTETRMSVVLPVSGQAPQMSETIRSLSEIAPGSAELVVAYHGSDHAVGKQLRREVLEAQRRMPKHTLRYVRTDPGTQFEGLNGVVNSVRAPLLTVMQAGDVIPPRWVEEVGQVFEQDNLAALLPYGDQPQVRQLFALAREQGVFFKPDSVFVTPHLLPNFVVRQAALRELGGFRPAGAHGRVPSILAFRQLLLRLLYKGWGILAETPLSLPQNRKPLAEIEALLPLFQLYCNAQVISELRDEFAAEPFAAVRAQHGFTLLLPDQITQSAKKLLTMAPPEWTSLCEASVSADQLRRVTQQYPNFVPAWILLEGLARQNGDLSLGLMATQGRQTAEAAQAAL